MAIARLGRMRQQNPELTEKYGPLNPDDISSYESRSGSPGIRPIDYVWSSPEENAEKSALLKKYAQDDPGLGQTIAKYTGQLWSSYPAHMGPGKDLYGMAQDQYLKERAMQRGVRQTHQKTRNPMVYPSYPGDRRE